MKEIYTKFAAAFFGIIVLALFISFLMAFPFMWLWNYAVVQALTFAQPIDIETAFYLMLFLSLFVKSPASSK